MFRSFPRTRESRATRAGVRGPWVPAFAGTSGDEERFNLVGTCFSRGVNAGVDDRPPRRRRIGDMDGAAQCRDGGGSVAFVRRVHHREWFALGDCVADAADLAEADGRIDRVAHAPPPAAKIDGGHADLTCPYRCDYAGRP